MTCNACDAHILAGHTENFDVILPTSLDPRFIVRDFGPGLSHEDVTNLYTTYFASTKSNSNDFIGALGLGSKSPFSYTETFSVVSYFGGEARGYTAFLDNGEPNLIETFREPSEERSGIEITVPAKDQDISKFQDEACYLFRSFNNIQPTIKNLRQDRKVNMFPESEYFSSNYGFEGSGFYAIMGNIVYPIEKDVAKGSWLRIVGGVHYFRFPLGELDITPSREELSLDEQTIANIEKRVKARDTIEAKSKVDEILAIDNPRTLTIMYNRYSQNIRQWLNTNVVHPLAKEYGSISQLSNVFDRAQIPTKHPIYEICNEPRMMYAKSTWQSRCSPKEITGLNVEHVTVLIDDKPSKRVQFVRGLNASGYDKSRYVILINESLEGDLKILADLKRAFPGNTMTVFRGSD